MSDSSIQEKSKQLGRISNDRSQFSMLAVDQRQSLRGMLAEKQKTSRDAVSDEALTLVKRIVAETVAPLSSGILLDPVYGFPTALESVSSYGGVLVSAEVTGYKSARGGERLTRLVDPWDAKRWREEGINAVKLLLWHHPDASDATRRHQEGIVQQVGEQCAEAGLPLLLESKVYARDETLTPEAWARKKPQYVIDAARTYSEARFEVDVLKLDFPGDLKYAAEFQPPDASWGEGTVVYEMSEVKEFCRRLDEAAGVPWVILSAGVKLDEFVKCIEFANAAGASGFLCGRTVWKHVLDAFPDEAEMQKYMEETGKQRFETILRANEAARPWDEHPRFRNVSESPSIAENS